MESEVTTQSIISPFSYGSDRHQPQSVHGPHQHVRQKMLPSVESSHSVWTMTVNSVHLSPLTYSVHYCADTSHA